MKNNSGYTDKELFKLACEVETLRRATNSNLDLVASNLKVSIHSITKLNEAPEKLSKPAVERLIKGLNNWRALYKKGYKVVSVELKDKEPNVNDWLAAFTSETLVDELRARGFTVEAKLEL